MLALQDTELAHPGVPLRKGGETLVVRYRQELDRKASRLPTFWRWRGDRVLGWR